MLSISIVLKSFCSKDHMQTFVKCLNQSKKRKQQENTVKKETPAHNVQFMQSVCKFLFFCAYFLLHFALFFFFVGFVTACASRHFAMRTIILKVAIDVAHRKYRMKGKTNKNCFPPHAMWESRPDCCNEDIFRTWQIRPVILYANIHVSRAHRM